MPPGKKSLKVDEPETEEQPKVEEKDASDIVKPLPKTKVEAVPMEQVTPLVEVPQGDTEADKVRAQLVTILKKYNMCESDIPVVGDSPDLEYWELRKKLQSMS